MNPASVIEQRFTSDPLLAALRVFLFVGIAVLCFAGIVLAVGAPLVLIMPNRVLAELAMEGAASLAGVPPLLALLLAGFAGICALVAHFFHLLLKITDTVRAGDPFTPSNATRLSRMAWTATLAYLLTLVLAVPATWVDEQLGEQSSLSIAAQFDIGSILLILVLFILARVFRQGAAMRADLDGIV